MSKLDKVNEAYLEEVKTENKKPVSVKQKQRYLVLCLAAVLLCLIPVSHLFSRPRHTEVQGRTITGQAQNGNTKIQEVPAEEKKTAEEKETKMPGQKNPEEVFIEVNTDWEITEGNKILPLGLVNPENSAYALRVSLFCKDQPEETLYESGMVKPGGSIAEAELTNALPAGEYETVIRYSFYQDGTEEALGEYELDASLHVKTGNQE